MGRIRHSYIAASDHSCYNVLRYNADSATMRSIMALEILAAWGKFIATFLTSENFHRNPSFRMIKQTIQNYRNAEMQS